MISESSELYKQVDPSKKDARWINESVSIIRRDWRQMVDTIRMRENKEILFSAQSMKKTKAQFKDKKFLKETEFIPLGIWNRIINTIVEELMEDGPKAELKATDPAAVSEKEADIFRLVNKKHLETAINQNRAAIGMPKYSLPGKEFNGNVDEFSKMGLDENDPDDINFYTNSGFQRLKWEIAGQSLLDSVSRINKFEGRYMRKMVIDILAAMVLCFQVYVDEITGEIKWKYIYPEEAYLIAGEEEDGSDDIAKGWERQLTLREFLGFVGNEFNFERDWYNLLWALNYANTRKFTGFIRNGITYNCQDNLEWSNRLGIQNEKAQLLDFNLAYTYKVYTGYVEWVSIDATATYPMAPNGDLVPEPISYDAALDKIKESEGYQKQSFYQEQMYKSYYLATSTLSQWIYKPGKLYYQQLEGAFDEYAKGTLLYHRLEGTSPVDISKSDIQFANDLYYKMKWVVYHAKPEKEQYVIPELIKVAKTLQRQYQQTDKNTAPSIDSILNQLIAYQHENFIHLRDYPEIEGKVMPSLAPTDGPRKGLDPLAMSLQAIEDWAEQRVAQKVGFNDMRFGQQENARQGYKQGMLETQNSIKSTGYIYRMVQKIKEDLCTTTLTYAQDIIRFNDTIPYKWIVKLIGDGHVDTLKILDKFAAHRLSIFVTDYNSKQEKQRLLQAADLALDKGDGRGGITIGEWALITQTEDYKRGLQILDFLKRKEAKKKRKEAIQDQKMKNEHEEKMKDMEAKMKQMESDNKMKELGIPAKASVTVAQINKEAKLETKELSNQHEPEKQGYKAESEKQILDKKAELESQKAFAE